MVVDELDVRTSSRNSLHVRRYHTWPMIQTQTNADHQCQMLRIYGCVWGPPSPAVTWDIIWHDAGEGETGDVPFGAKRRFPVLKVALDEAEAQHVQLLVETDAPGWGAAGVFLTEQEALRVKACDLVEGLEHALVDVAMGNRLAGPVVSAYSTGWLAHAEKMSADDLMPLADVYLRRPYHQKLWSIYQDACCS